MICIRNIFYTNPKSTYKPVKKGSAGHADIILIHGWPFMYDYRKPLPILPNNDLWFPGFIKKYGKEGYKVVAPEFPNSFRPNYQDWKNALEQYDIDEKTIMIGHSFGGGFLIRYFSEKDAPKVKKIVLLAPWLGDFTGFQRIIPQISKCVTGDNFPGDDEFYNFKIDRKMKDKTKDGIVLIKSTNDEPAIRASIKTIIKSIDGLDIHTYPMRGHFMDAEVPELYQHIDCYK